MCAALTSWAYPHPLTPVAFAEFVQSVLTNLPSSSNGPSAASPAATFGSLLIDIMWSIDLQLDEFLSEAKAAVGSSADETMQGVKDAAGLMVKAKRAQQNAEGDKQRLQSILKKLLVNFLNVVYLCIAHGRQEFGAVNPTHCRERLETSLIAGTGLIQEKSSFDKKEVRMRTGLLYVCHVHRWLILT